MQAQTSLQYKPLYSEKWGKKIQTARYNGTRTVCKNSSLIENQKLFFRECCFDGPLRRVCLSFPTGSAAANIWNLSPKNVMWPIMNLLRSKWWSFVSVCPSVCDLTPPVLTDFFTLRFRTKTMDSLSLDYHRNKMAPLLYVL